MIVKIKDPEDINISAFPTILYEEKSMSNSVV